MATMFRLTQSQICQNGIDEYKKFEQQVQKLRVQDTIIKWEDDVFTTVCFIFNNNFQFLPFSHNVNLTSITFKWMVELMSKQHFVSVRDDLTIIPVRTRRCFDLPIFFLYNVPYIHTTLFWHPYDVVLTWMLYRHRNDVVVICCKRCEKI